MTVLSLGYKKKKKSEQREQESSVFLLGCHLGDEEAERGGDTVSEDVGKLCHKDELDKRPHAEWLADATELDSLIKCDVVGGLPAFTKTSPLQRPRPRRAAGEGGN